jgi:charged multivesicular body protein 3
METLRHYFGKPTPQEQVRKWQSSIRHETRLMDRQIQSIAQSEAKTKQQIKTLAKRGDVKHCRMLAREVVRAKRVRNRMEASKATMASLSMQLSEQLAQAKITGVLQKSTIMMKDVNGLVKMPELQATMSKLQMEMQKAGIMDEMMDDVMDFAGEEEDEEEAEEEVNRILGEITGESFAKVDPVPSTPLNTAPTAEEEEEADALEAMRSRLQALKE